MWLSSELPLDMGGEGGGGRRCWCCGLWLRGKVGDGRGRVVKGMGDKGCGLRGGGREGCGIGAVDAGGCTLQRQRR